MIGAIFDEGPFKEFRGYLERLRSGSGIIHFDDIDLMDVHKIAPWIYVLDVAQDQGVTSLTFRFVGTSLCDGIGFEPTGRSLDDLDFGPGQEQWRDAYRTIVRTRQPHVLSFVHQPDVEKMSPFKKGKPNCLVRLAYPVFGADGAVTNIIGVGQFISLDHAEADRFYEFALDAAADRQPATGDAISNASPFQRGVSIAQDWLFGRMPQFQA